MSNKNPDLLNQEYTILSVSEVVNLLRDVLAHAFPLFYFQGELGPVSRASSGHLYFTIKDPATNTAIILNCVIWRQVAQRLSFLPTEGMLVECQGAPTIYPASGRLQLVVSVMQVAGQGALRQRFEALKARLGAEGLFAVDRKRSLPFFPQCVGVVTSRSGSVIHDIAVTINSRMPGTRIVLAHAKVQGEGSAIELARAIRQLNEIPEVEVIIVARGGGSLEDLWAFNEEETVRAIFGSRLPVISAVGHETDTTLSDLVADVRAPTPTGAGRIVVPDRGELLERLRSLQVRIGAVDVILRNFEQRVDSVALRLKEASVRYLQYVGLLFARLEMRLREQRPALKIERMRARSVALQWQLEKNYRCLLDKKNSSMDRIEQLLHSNVRENVREIRGVLDLLGARLASVNPISVLDRGYAVIRQPGEGGQIFMDAKAVPLGTDLEVQMRDGLVNIITIDKTLGRK
jgi:exodeoxyribonuclease VII large subunit